MIACYEQVTYIQKILLPSYERNEQQFVMCHVLIYDGQNSEFDVKEMATPQQRRPMSFTVKLNEWWCDCGEFQALRLPCAHVMAVYSYSHLDFTMFVSPVYTLHNIFKAYEIQFHPAQNQDYWSPYTGPYFIPNLDLRWSESERPVTTQIHNEMDEPIPNRP